jgi:hypothetical protein
VRYLDEERCYCTWNSKMTDKKQSNTESEGVSEYGKTISNHSQHWKRENDLDGELHDDITCTKPSRQHQATRMSNKVTWLLREPQLEEVIKTRLSFVHPSFLVRIFEDYQSTQSLFAIQFRIIGPPYIGCSLSICPSLIKSLESLIQHRVCLQFKSESLDRSQLALPIVYSLQTKLWKNTKSNFLRQWQRSTKA